MISRRAFTAALVATAAGLIIPDRKIFALDQTMLTPPAIETSWYDVSMPPLPNGYFSYVWHSSPGGGGWHVLPDHWIHDKWPLIAITLRNPDRLVYVEREQDLAKLRRLLPARFV